MSLSKQDFNVADVVFKCKVELSRPDHTKYIIGRQEFAKIVLSLLEYTYNPYTKEVKHAPRSK